MKKMQIDIPPKQGNESPFQRFERLTKRVISIPKQVEKPKKQPTSDSTL